MRTISRGNKPKTLTRNATRWTADLQREITSKGSYASVNKKFKNKYKHPKVRESLGQMYNRYCCYCETDFEKTGYARIDHRQPASKFPQLAFEWSNLHLSCEVCNSEKSDEWDNANPILDPTTDDIKSHLKACVITGEIFDLSPRGLTTIQHTKLTRETLNTARLRIANRYRDIILYAYQTNNSDLKRKYLIELSNILRPNPITNIVDTEYSMLFKELLETYRIYL